jgi:DNA-binding NarL/FixJ family response regulator
MKVVLVDDHQLFRIGIRYTLSTTSAWEVVGEASRARDAFAIVDAERPDVVILDIALPGMDGVVATREVRRRTQARVLILTASDQLQDVLDGFEAGASGYALKDEDSRCVLQALDAIMSGQRYVAPALVRRLAAFESQPREANLLSVLSEREREIFRLAAQCMISREIAGELCISRKTVDTHLYRIHHKLGVRSAAELVRVAAQLGLVHQGQVWRRRSRRPLAADGEAGTPLRRRCRRRHGRTGSGRRARPSGADYSASGGS